MRTYKAYTVIESSEVSDAIAEAIKDHPRVEDVFEALKWRIARDPECGTVVDHAGTSYRLVAFSPVAAAKNSQIMAKYTVDDQVGEVSIHDVYLIPFDPSSAYSPKAFDLDA